VSDQQEKNTEQAARESAPIADSPQGDAAPAMPGPAAAAGPAPAARRGSGPVAWLALLLVLALAAALGWSMLEQRRLQSEIDSRLQAVEALGGRDQASFDELDRRLRQQLQDGLSRLEGSMGELASDSGLLGQSVEALRSELAAQRAELASYAAIDREDWLLAEVEYLLRLANQRLVMAGDTGAAQALLGSADKILLELDEADLHGVRAAVAADLAAVRAVPALDIEGVYLSLAALIEQAGQLKIFQLPEQSEQASPPPAENWQARLQQGYEQALAKLSSYIIIRRRDVPMQVLMDPQWEGLVRQNLRMLLEQAQVALLSGNGQLYRESLQRAQHWVAEFFESDGAAARAMYAEIERLREVEVEVQLPDLSRSLQALDETMRERLLSGGGE
jgi:uroporphyrin-3 C-methyltransferase